MLILVTKMHTDFSVKKTSIDDMENKERVWVWMLLESEITWELSIGKMEIANLTRIQINWIRQILNGVAGNLGLGTVQGKLKKDLRELLIA